MPLGLAVGPVTAACRRRRPASTAASAIEAAGGPCGSLPPPAGPAAAGHAVRPGGQPKCAHCSAPARTDSAACLRYRLPPAPTAAPAAAGLSRASCFRMSGRPASRGRGTLTASRLPPARLGGPSSSGAAVVPFGLQCLRRRHGIQPALLPLRPFCRRAPQGHPALRSAAACGPAALASDGRARLSSCSSVGPSHPADAASVVLGSSSRRPLSSDGRPPAALRPHGPPPADGGTPAAAGPTEAPAC
ncbi:transcriptional regulatory protein AlgP-like [Penaeus chinensis]|uniref:transcriptional regulatory protein AlgP-like n=1 Tax=Penaeus chinensis TaxID=139456 RepID=UPI001FB5EE4F|nr:transcriptional regulatory protein AlgP-like [Penaeus chinensis]